MSELLLIDDDASLTELLGTYFTNQATPFKFRRMGKPGCARCMNTRRI